MTSFKLYLPSNACPNVYPNNTPTDFRTVFDKPIELDGQWEVGLESICYSSNIHDESEDAHMSLHVGKVTRPLLNNEYAFRYRVNVDETWPGFTGVQPTTFESDPKKLDSVLNTLNSLNDVILTSGKAFHFRRNAVGDAFFVPYDEYLFLRLSPYLTKLLGYRSETTLGGHTKNGGNRPTDDLRPLTQKDYHVYYLHTVLQRQKTFTLKDRGIPYDGKRETINALWKKNIPNDIDSQFDSKQIAVELSTDLWRTFRQPRFAFGAVDGNAENIITISHNATHELWYLDVYTTEMIRRRHYDYTTIPLTIMPWKSNTIRELLHVITLTVARTLKRALKKSYHSKRHEFSLKLQPSQHVTLTLGKRLEVEFSINLTHLLGLPQERLKRSQTNAVREVDALFNRSRQLHLLTNIVQPTAIGNKQVKILRDFVHISTKDPLSVRHFDTVSYVPVIVNRIDNIHMQLTNDMFDSVMMKDIKTLVTLYFRKI